MDLIRYFSANIFSFIGNILFFIAMDMFWHIPQLASVDTINIGLNLSALLIPLLILQLIEWQIRRYKPCLLPKMKVCKYCKFVHCFIFSLGYVFAICCSYLFLIIMTPVIIHHIKGII